MVYDLLSSPTRAFRTKLGDINKRMTPRRIKIFTAGNTLGTTIQ